MLDREILAVDTRAILSLRLTKEFGRKSQLLAGSLNCAYLCPFASVRSKRNTWHVYKETGREESARWSGTGETGTTNALCPQSTYRSSVSFFVSLSLRTHMSLSLAFLVRDGSPCISEAYWSLGALWSTKGSIPRLLVPTPDLSFVPSTHDTHTSTPSPSPLWHVRRLSLSRKVPLLSSVPRQWWSRN